MRNSLILVLAVVVGLGFAGLAVSEEPSSVIERKTDELVSGIQETVVGSVQVPLEMAETVKENPVEAVTLAPVRGAKETALQTTEGAAKAATFFIPDETSATTQTQ
ncbi:MAG: hypothetical protein ABH845_00510 [Candidatus Omnitrophota bacterium]